MKKSFLLMLLITFVTQSQWIQMNNGMGERTVNALTVSGNIIIAGTLEGVFVSGDNGLNWIQSALISQPVYSLATDGNNLFAGTESNGVYISTNNGATWSQTSLNNRFVYSLTINGNYVFAGTDTYGVYVSKDKGASWFQTSLNNGDIWSLITQGNNIFAGTDGDGMYRTSDKGETWSHTLETTQSVRALAVNGNNIYAGTFYNVSAVYLSVNNGASWNPMITGPPFLSLIASGSNVFAGTHNGVYLTNNNGFSWRLKNEGFPPYTRVNTLCISDIYIFAGTQVTGVYRRPLDEITGIYTNSSETPEKFSLSQNYPNPFNPATNIEFAIPKAGFVKLTIFDMLGHELEILVNENLNAGTYNADWNASNYSSGVYLYKIQTGDFSEIKKMVLVK